MATLYDRVKNRVGTPLGTSQGGGSLYDRVANRRKTTGAVLSPLSFQFNLGGIRTTTPATTAQGTIEGAGILGREIGQSISRNVASFIGSEALAPAIDPVLKKIGEVERKSPFFAGFTEDLGKRLLGDISEDLPIEFTGETRAEQIAPIGERIIAFEKTLEKKKKEYDELLKTPNLTRRERATLETLSSVIGEKKGGLAPIIIGGFVGIDIFPVFGSTDDFFKAMIKVNSRGDATNLLRKVNVAEDLIEGFADDVVKVGTRKDAEKLFESIANLQKTTKQVPIPEGLPQITPKTAPQQAVRAVDDPLTLEARKYKSAEELITKTDLSIKQKPQTLFRGFNPSTAQAQNLVIGKHFSDDLNIAREFAISAPAKRMTRPGETIKVVSAYKLSPNAKIANLDKVKQFFSIKRNQLANKETITKALKDAGYDGAVGTLGGGGKEWIIVNERMVKKIQYKPFTALTPQQLEALHKSQLTDIWERAKKKLPELPKISRAPTAQRILGQEPPRQITRGEDVALRERVRAEARGAKEGARATREQIAQRRLELRALKNRFNMTDAELARIRGQRDISAMTNDEFTDFIGRAEVRAQQEAERSEALVQLRGTIFEKEFIKEDNLRKAMELPPISKMDISDIKLFDGTLQQYKQGDRFLSVRQIETVDNTDLIGIRTQREAQERLLEDVNVLREANGGKLYTLEDLQSIKVSELDRFRYDAALSRRNAFYRLLVDEKSKAFLTANMDFLKIRDDVDVLVKAARKSRPRTVRERLIPTDKRIFNWLEVDDTKKIELAKDMTKEELNASQYIRGLFVDARDYLAQQGVLKKYQQDYITHIRRGFLEAWNEDSFMAAFREAFNQYKLDEAVFDILNQKTGDILPLEKFFRFSMRRTGELEPSKNVAKAVEAYFGALSKKKALDSIVPKLDIYAHSLTPKRLTPRGLEFDDSLKRFVNEWVNTKKGRVAEALVKPGGKIDWTLRTGLALTRLIDLGFSIPIGIATSFGEQSANFISMGVKAYSKGVARLATKQGRSVVNQYENFIGEPVLKGMARASEDIGDKLGNAAYSLFSAGTRKANQVYLLGSMTDAEFKVGKITVQRLSEIQQKMSRYRVTPDAKSIIGSTSLGMVGTQYKTWAVPLMSSTLDNISSFQRVVRAKGFAKAMADEKTRELLRSILLMSAISYGTYGYFQQDKKVSEMTFLEEIAFKSARDALSLLGAIDPALFTSEPRLMQFVANLGEGMSQIIQLEKNKEGELKGVKTLERTLEPAPIRQLRREPQTTTKRTRQIPIPSGLPSLPSLQGLPIPAGLPSI